jgi:hypothetical protein
MTIVSQHMTSIPTTDQDKASSTRLLLDIQAAARVMLPSKNKNQAGQFENKEAALQAFVALLDKILKAKDLQCMLNWSQYCLLIEKRERGSARFGQFVRPAIHASLEEACLSVPRELGLLFRACLCRCLG